MNLFQYLALCALAIMLAREVLGAAPGVAASAGARGSSLRIALWCGAALAIAMPQITQSVAHVLGIARGADLVHYLSILAFMAAAFHLYAKNFTLEQQLTELIRNQAIREAEFGENNSFNRRHA